MGYWSERQILEGELHFHAEPGMNVCAACIDDYALKDIVEANMTADICDFCGCEDAEPIAAAADLIIEQISRSLHRSYADPNGLLFPDKENGGWIGASVMDFDEVLAQIGGDELGSKAFDEFVRNAFRETEWCTNDPATIDEVEALQFSWAELSETVKHRQRFFFAKSEEIEPTEKREPGPPLLHGGAMLEQLGSLIREFGLVAQKDAGLVLFRARDHDAGASLQTAGDLGAPEHSKASQSRMSPAGIPMFYAAESPETALSEIAGLSDATESSVGVWRTTEACRIVDLTQLPRVPSPFDETEKALRTRPSLGFLHGFRFDVSRPIVRDKRIHIDYVPTQVVCEYLRYVFQDDDGEAVNGLAWQSAQDGTGKNVVLFLDDSRCVENGERPPLRDGLLVELLKSYEHSLEDETEPTDP
jgi:hypothetical protein